MFLVVTVQYTVKPSEDFFFGPGGGGGGGNEVGQLRGKHFKRVSLKTKLFCNYVLKLTSPLLKHYST
jgi:hypothetical protein